MKYAIVIGQKNYGPYKNVEVLADRYRCDGIELPFSVVGQGQIVDADTVTFITTTAEELIEEVTASVQKRLDDFASTRNYDGILSACTYAYSTNDIFRPEGQYCVEARDETWAKCYQILTEVQIGVRQMPNSYAEIESELPTLSWPEKP